MTVHRPCPLSQALGGATITSVLGYESVPTDKGLAVSIGDVQSEASKKLLVAMDLRAGPADPPELPILHYALEYIPVGLGQRRSKRDLTRARLLGLQTKSLHLETLEDTVCVRHTDDVGQSAAQDMEVGSPSVQLTAICCSSCIRVGPSLYFPRNHFLYLIVCLDFFLCGLDGSKWVPTRSSVKPPGGATPRVLGRQLPLPPPPPPRGLRPTVSCQSVALRRPWAPKAPDAP